MTTSTNLLHPPRDRRRPADRAAGVPTADAPERGPAPETVHDRRARGRGRTHVPPGQLKKAGIAYFGWCFDEGTSQEDILVADPAGGTIARITDDSHNPVFTSDRDPAWSPDRRFLAIHRASELDTESRLMLLRAKTGVTEKVLVPGCCPEWYDEHTLLFLREGGDTDPVTGEDRWWTDVYAVDVDTLAVTRVTDLSGSSTRAGELSWHPSAGLALGLEDAASPGSVSPYHVVTVPAGRVAATLAGGAPVTRTELTAAIPDATSPDWSPDGRRIAHVYFTQIPYPDPSQCEPGDPCTMLAADVAVTTLADGTSVRITTDGPDGTPYGDDFGGQSPAFSPDGRQVAFTRGYEDGWQEIWLSPSTSSAPVRLTDEGRRCFKGGLDW